MRACPTPFVVYRNPNTPKAIQAKLDAGEKPTPEIVSFILRDQTIKAQGLLRKDSSLVCHAICVNAFSTVGWHFDKNCGCVRAHALDWLTKPEQSM